MIKMEVHSTRAVIRSQEPLTVGLRGAKARFAFGASWAELIKTAVFRQGDKTVAVANIGEEVTIPWEVLTLPGVPVQIGVYGTDSTGEIAIPTLWAETEPVRPGTDPEGDPSAEPTPGLWEQLQGKLGSLEQLETDEKSNLVAAINEVNRPVCVITVYDNGDGTYGASKTVDEITAMLENGVPLICFWYDQNVLLYMTDYQNNSIDPVHVFTTVSNLMEYRVVIKRNGVSCSMTELPTALKVTITQNEDGTYKAKPDFTQILDAYNNGHDVYCQYKNTVLPLVTVTNAFCIFSCIHSGTVYTVQVGASNVKVTTTPVVKTVNGIAPDQYGNVATEAPAPVYLVTFDASNKAEQSYSDIQAAYQAGLNLQCDYKGYLLPLKAVIDTDYVFAGIVDTTSYSITVRSNGNAIVLERSLAKNADIPTNTSQLENDSGFLTEAPVTSVNDQTGAVSLPVPVKVTVTQQSDGSYSADLSTVQIVTAKQRGSTVYCCYEDLVLSLSYASPGRCIFTCIDGGRLHTVSVASSGITVTDTPIADDLLFDKETGMLYLKYQGQIIGNGVQLEPTGGSNNNAVLTLNDSTGWAHKAIPQDSQCMISFEWSSLEDGISTGPGTVMVKVGGVLRYSAMITQGERLHNISDYLSLGYNMVNVTVFDIYNNSQTITLAVNVYDPDALKSTKLVEKTLSGDYTNDRVTFVGDLAFHYLNTLDRISLPNVTVVGFRGLGTSCDELDLNAYLTGTENAFNLANIGILRLPWLTSFNAGTFIGATIGRIIMNRIETMSNGLHRVSTLGVLDCHKLTLLNGVPDNMSTCIIRTPTVCTLENAPSSANTSKLYVPASLVDSYKTATNWSSMADRIFAIEDYPDICEVN